MQSDIVAGNMLKLYDPTGKILMITNCVDDLVAN